MSKFKIHARVYVQIDGAEFIDEFTKFCRDHYITPVHVERGDFDKWWASYDIIDQPLIEEFLNNYVRNEAV